MDKFDTGRQVARLASQVVPLIWHAYRNRTYSQLLSTHSHKKCSFNHGKVSKI